MTRSLIVAAVALAGCATTPQAPQVRTHADNVTAAAREGYRVINKDGQTLFCRIEPPIGSHVIPGCLTEAQWEQRQPSFALGWMTSGVGESGRSPTSGSGGPYVGH
jgi:hypothetical protein